MKATLRIPMMIDANGAWAAYGFTGCEKSPPWDIIDEAADPECPLNCPQRFWITVEVELPEVRDIAATKVEIA